MELSNRIFGGEMNISLEFTNHCNFRCYFCPHSLYKTKHEGNPFDREKGFLKRKTFRKALEFIKKKATAVTIGYFGEQLLHERFNEYVTLLDEDRKFKLVLNTNFSLVTDEHLRYLNKFDRIRISLDATDSETFEKLCPGGAIKTFGGANTFNRFESLVKKIREYLKMEERPSVRLIFVKSRFNEGKEELFEEQWKPYLKTSDIITFKSVLSYGGVIQDGIVREGGCAIANGNVGIISWEGDITPCNLDVNMAMKSGNVFDKEFPDKALWGAALHSIRRNEGICQKCVDGGNHSQRSVYGML